VADLVIGDVEDHVPDLGVGRVLEFGGPIEVRDQVLVFRSRSRLSTIRGKRTTSSVRNDGVPPTWRTRRPNWRAWYISSMPIWIHWPRTSVFSFMTGSS